MAAYLQSFYDEQGQRQTALTNLRGVLSGDPGERAAIAQKYQQDVQSRAGSLAGRGLSERGYSGADLADVERSRILAENDQNVKLRAAKAEYTSTIAGLNSRRAAEDTNALLLAGQNIQAGTGRFAKTRPGGWKPPSLQGIPDVNPDTGQPARPAAHPAVPVPKPPTTLGPTGARLPTTPAGGGYDTGRVVRNRRGLAVGFARRQVRVA